MEERKKKSIIFVGKQQPTKVLQKKLVDEQKITDEVNDFFDTLETRGLTYREGQHNMALDIATIDEHEKNLLFEAGVGIGKSFGYLVPLIIRRKITGKQFIISTSTIALQDQLKKDIETITGVLNVSLNWVLAKGMTNYLCVKRYYELKEKLEKEEKLLEKLSESERIRTEEKIKKWERLFTIINEYSQDRNVYPNIEDSSWQNICVSDCSYNRCPYHEECAFYELRQKMKSSNTDLVVCNHNLLIEDLLKDEDKKLLIQTDAIVVDEAHSLEQRFRDRFTYVIDIYKIERILENANRRLNQIDNKTKNVLKQFSEKIKLIVKKQKDKLEKKGISLEDFDNIALKFDDELRNIIKELENRVRIITDDLEIKYAADYKYNADLESVIDELYEVKGMLHTLTREEDSIFWIDQTGRQNVIKYISKRLPNIIGKYLNDNYAEIHSSYFFNRDKRKIKFIFTSATLSTTENNYSYFLDNLGLKENAIEISDQEHSPYDYDNNTKMYFCTDIDSPKHKKAYLEGLVEHIYKLIKLTNGKTLVLFTSKSDMKYVYENIKDKLTGLNIYIQNDGSNQDIVKNKFKEETDSVLFSTGIFWEGIDIKGESLSNLIIARLPFPIVDPVLEYRMNSHDKGGFEKTYLAEMLIKLKQGVGRLIRSEEDKGIVSILDCRARKYEKILKSILPIKNITYDFEEIVDFVIEKGINVEVEKEEPIKLVKE